MSMTIQTETQHGAVILQLEGRIDEMTVAALRKECTSWILQGAKTLVLDFAAVTHVSSVGIHAILMAGKQIQEAGGVMQLSGSHGRVARAFQISGLATILPTFENLDELTRELEPPAPAPIFDTPPSVRAWGWTTLNSSSTDAGTQCEMSLHARPPAQSLLPSVTPIHLPKLVSEDNSIASWLVRALCHPVACLDFCASWWRRVLSMELTLSKR